ncbi:trans-acting transcription factor 9, isoform CRA_b, partial [Mus musculus]
EFCRREPRVRSARARDAGAARDLNRDSQQPPGLTPLRASPRSPKPAMATSILGEEPRFGTTPLAMLAATCNKIGNTSPLTTLPESSAFAKGGFHPWKRSSSSCNLGSSLSGFAVATGGRGSGSLAGGSGAANSAFCLASTSPTSSAFSSDYGGLFSNSAAAAAAAAGVSPQEAGGQSAFISKVHTTAADGLYPRVGMAHPYESWYKSGFHST